MRRGERKRIERKNEIIIPYMYMYICMYNTSDNIQRPCIIHKQKIQCTFRVLLLNLNGK